MSTQPKATWRDAMRRTLVQHAGSAPSAGSISYSVLTTWSQISAVLVPLIGVRGVDALLDRAVHITGVRFPWLARAGDHPVASNRLEFLKARIEAREVSIAIEASNAVLANVVELLEALIGESLTERLLDPVWVPVSTSHEQETP